MRLLLYGIQTCRGFIRRKILIQEHTGASPLGESRFTESSDTAPWLGVTSNSNREVKMKFSHSYHQDDVLFVIALLLPAVFAGFRYAESDREMDQLARAHAPVTMATSVDKKVENVHLAYAQSHGR